MNKKKELPNVKLQKTSVIFMQLGLILAMFIVYLILESETIYKPVAFNDVTGKDFIDDEPVVKPFEVEKNKPKPKVITNTKIKLKNQKVAPKPSSTFEIAKNDSKEKEMERFISSDDDDDPVKLTSDDIGEVVENDDPSEVFPFYKIEFAPEYPGCTGSKEAKKACFNKKINNFVKRKFNADLAQELGLSAGKKKISIQFVIDTKGDIVDVKVRAPHKRLEKEAKRLVNLLPKMKPARQGLHNANVRFNLPIVFIVED